MPVDRQYVQVQRSVGAASDGCGKLGAEVSHAAMPARPRARNVAARNCRHFTRLLAPVAACQPSRAKPASWDLSRQRSAPADEAWMSSHQPTPFGAANWAQMAGTSSSARPSPPLARRAMLKVASRFYNCSRLVDEATCNKFDTGCSWCTESSTCLPMCSGGFVSGH